jgi:hypothetical protein
LGEDDEHHLRDLLGSVEITGFPQSGGIHQVHVARNQDGKGGVGIPDGVLPQQIHVGRVVHPLISGRRRQKVPTNFDSMQSRKQTTGSLNAEMQRTPGSAEENKLCETLRSPRLCVGIFAQENKSFVAG